MPNKVHKFFLYSFLAGLAYKVLYGFMAGEKGAYLVIFLMGAGLFTAPFEILMGLRRTPPPKEGYSLPPDAPIASLHARMHDPRYVAFPENDMYRLYSDDYHG